MVWPNTFLPKQCYVISITNNVDITTLQKKRKMLEREREPEKTNPRKKIPNSILLQLISLISFLTQIFS